MSEGLLMRYVKIISTIFFILILVYAYISGLAHYLSLSFVKQCGQDLLSYTCAHYLLTIFLFCLVCILSTALSLPWAALLSITAGYLFGIYSLLFVIPALAIGGLCAFLIARYLLGSFVQQRWGSYLQKFNAELAAYGAWYLLIIRFIPIFPFFLVNSVAALTPISARVFLGATLIGIIPPTSIFVFSGTQLAEIDSISDVFSQKIIFAFGLLVLLVIAPAIYKRFFVRS